MLVSCAPMPTTQQNQAPQTKVTLKQLPKLTPSEKSILKNNGFAVGIWSDNCSDKNAYQSKYYDDGEKYLAEYFENAKLVRRAEFYEVKQVSPGVVQFKTLNVSTVNDMRYISSNKTAYANGKRMQFDLSILPLTGPATGTEITQVKDGILVKAANDGSFEKIKPVTPTFKCN